MKTNQINNIGLNSNRQNTNFGMAVVVKPNAKKLLEDSLTVNATKKLKNIMNAEKSNPTNVNITTKTGYLATNYFPERWPKYDYLVANVEDKDFKPNSLLSIFSSSKAIMSAIKKAVKYANELTEKRKNIN